MTDWTEELLDGCKNGELEKVRIAIDNDAKMKKGYASVLTTASEAGYLDIVRYLIEEKGLDIHYADNEALGCAAYSGHYGVVEYLISQGADVTDHNNFALIESACEDNIEIIKLLVESGADVNANDKYNNTVLSQAAGRGGNLDIVKYLIAEGADIATLNYSAISNASLRKQDKIVYYLLAELIKSKSFKDDKTIFTTVFDLLKKEHQSVFKKILLEGNKKIIRENQYDLPDSDLGL